MSLQHGASQINYVGARRPLLAEDAHVVRVQVGVSHAGSVQALDVVAQLPKHFFYLRF